MNLDWTVLCLVLGILLFGSVGLPAAEDGPPVYKDPSRSVEDRVADLLVRMTLEEKVAQLTCLWGEKGVLFSEDGRFDPERAAEAIPHGLGYLARPADTRGVDDNSLPSRSPKETVELVNAIQGWLMEHTRLGIPALLHEEALHGLRAEGGTHFPQAIALASTWDPDLVEEVFSRAARETRALGVHHVLAPVVDVARDPRWGRVEETFGEDPHLVAEMGLAAVRGFQGREHFDVDDVLSGDRVLATLKHMTGHGQPESGTNIGPAQISERVLREVFFPPFERAVREAGAQIVMASYNEIDGVPSHVNAWLLDDVLRREWRFEGVVVADYFAIRELKERHRVVPSLAEGARQALAAGVDVELPDPETFPSLIELARNDEEIASLVDRAVERSLRLRFLAGVFEDPFGDADEAERLMGDEESRELARRSAEQALILLKNDDDLLPLDLAGLERIAVIGPNADETILGGYSATPAHTVSILEGIREHVGHRAEVLFAKGAHITATREFEADEVVLADADENRRLIAEAAEVASQADVAVVAIGGNEHTCREAWAENHLGDRADLQLVGEQLALVESVLATGTPTVVVLIHGRPLAITSIAEKVPAILDGWILGQETGGAVARVLFGEVNPGGKLAVSIPRSVGQLPSFYNHKPTARRGFLFGTTEPLWPIGFGLSYTSFAISDLELSASEMAPNGEVQASVVVTNTGDRRGDEVVQLYINDLVSSVTRPVKELKAFHRITLESGESQRVEFTIGAKQLEFFDRDLHRVVEAGVFEIMIGNSSVDLCSARLRVTAGSSPPRSAMR